jgi:hypothetical protein
MSPDVASFRNLTRAEVHRSSMITRLAGVFACLCALASPAAANVITDWDENAVTLVTPLPPYVAARWMGMLHAAMFDAVNSIEPRYRPYLAQLPSAPATSKEAAATSAAVAILATIDPKTAERARALGERYLAAIPEGGAKSDGIRLGEAVAAKVLQARAGDGSDAPDAYRPRTTPGVYVPTAITAGAMWPNVKPFALGKPSQFRPRPPIALTSEEWARDFNEIKEYGNRSSAKRSPQQTETARFWLMTGPQAYHPFVRRLVDIKQMSVVDSARLMALVAFGLSDAYVAVLDAKYHYEFWRPITAIRNGDIDGNAATDREATWQPIDITPMHPEYPCAHCIQSGTVAGIVSAALPGLDVSEATLTSPTAPGAIHRWTNMKALTEEVANARIWAGFHYRFSTRVGDEMGRQIGEYVVKSVMRPQDAPSR